MKLEDQVVSLDLVKQLKEAGYPQDGLWWWVDKILILNKVALAYSEKCKIVAPTEYWVNIPLLKGLYQISNFGQVRRVESKIEKRRHHNQRIVYWKGRIVRPTIANGYYRVCLSVDNLKIYISPHRVMAEVFLPNPKLYIQVNHKNGNKLANWIENLEWCTAKQNTQHAFKTGLRKKHKRDKKGMFTERAL